MNIGEVGRNQAAATATSATPQRAELERDNFMELLLMQLRSQDPMNPMDSSAMFNQMAQLSILEQLWDIRDTLSESAASQQLANGSLLIGRYVEATSPETGTFSGLVEQVRMIGGNVLLQIADREVPLENVVSVE